MAIDRIAGEIMKVPRGLTIKQLDWWYQASGRGLFRQTHLGEEVIIVVINDQDRLRGGPVTCGAPEGVGRFLMQRTFATGQRHVLFQCYPQSHS